jgi:hypothetical protein
MVPEAGDIPDDLEQLRRRFEEFRKAQPGQARLPESLWAAATELAKRYGVNRTAGTFAVGVWRPEEASRESGPTEREAQKGHAA